MSKDGEFLEGFADMITDVVVMCFTDYRWGLGALAIGGLILWIYNL